MEPRLAGSWWGKRGLSRQVSSPDSSFSLEPHEFKERVDAIRIAEKAIDEVSYEITEKQKTAVCVADLFLW